MTVPDFSPYRLVPFAPRYENDLIALIASVYGEYRQVIELDTLDADLREVPRVYAGPDCAFWTLLDGERLIGSVAVKRTAPGEAELKRVFLNPAYRGKGLGKRLVQWAFAWAAARGARTLHIWSDVTYRTSHGLYRALGAEDTGRQRLLGGVNRVEEFYFRKTLAPAPEAHNPQAALMADESMVRNLAAQAQAIWPQEEPIFRRYRLPGEPRIVDVGCGTGEISARLLALFSRSTLRGVDLLESNLAHARARCANHGARASFARGDAFALDFPAAAFDLSVCRHMLQAVPHAEKVVAELVRVTRPGGRVHLVAEDYGMMHFHPTRLDSDEFWRRGPMAFAAADGTDLRSGRKMYAILADLGLADVTVDYVTIDTQRVPRELFAAIWTAWKDGYATAIAEKSGMPLADVLAHWDDMIDCIRNPRGHAVWQLPVIGGTVPA